MSMFTNYIAPQSVDLHSRTLYNNNQLQIKTGSRISGRGSLEDFHLVTGAKR